MLKLRPKIFWNNTGGPIIIVTRWEPNPTGGPGIPTTSFMIEPGQGIDLNIVGLSDVKEAHYGDGLDTDCRRKPDADK